MDGMDWTVTTAKHNSSPYGDDYIPGGWLQLQTSSPTRKRKATFDLPVAKRPSPSRPVASFDLVQSLKSLSPVKAIQKLFNSRTYTSNGSSASRSQDEVSIGRSNGKRPAQDIVERKQIYSTPEGKQAGSARTHQSGSKPVSSTTDRFSTEKFRSSQALLKPITNRPVPTAMESFRVSRGHNSTTLDLRSMYADQKRARKDAFARAALLQIKQPRSKHSSTSEQGMTATDLAQNSGAPNNIVSMKPASGESSGRTMDEEQRAKITASMGLTSRQRAIAQPLSNPPSPSLQLFHELEASLQPTESDSDAENTTIDPSWTIPSKRHPRMSEKLVVINGPQDLHAEKSGARQEEHRQSHRLHPPGMSPRPVPSLDSRRTAANLTQMSHPSISRSSGTAPQKSGRKVAALLDPRSDSSAEKHTVQTRAESVSTDANPGVNAADVQSCDEPKGTTKESQVLSELDDSLLGVAQLRIDDDLNTRIDTPKASGHAGEKLKRLTRAQLRRKQLEEESLNQFEIVPLSSEWDAKVRQAVRQGHGNYAASDLARAVPEYAGRGQDNWLNDEVINGYLNLITAHGKKNDRPNQTPTFHAFNSFFYNNLSTKGPDSVMRWSKRPKINGPNLLNVEAVFIPINTGVHWTLAVVEPKKRSITHYNSMRSGALGVAACEHIKKWVAKELGKEFNEDEWTLIAVGESPQQTNSDDCGVFTITSARQIMLGFNPMSYRSDQMQVQRKRIVAELINNGLLKSRNPADIAA